MYSIKSSQPLHTHPCPALCTVSNGTFLNTYNSWKICGDAFLKYLFISLKSLIGVVMFAPCLFCPSDNFETCLALLTC